jgi:hypothetical protein
MDKIIRRIIMEPATITLAITTALGLIWGYLERRAKNISKEEYGKVEDKLLNAASGGYTADEVFDVVKDIVKFSRD